jgi:hypothetical protein
MYLFPYFSTLLKFIFTAFEVGITPIPEAGRGTIMRLSNAQ